MSLLRIFCSLAPVPAPCQWVLFDDHAGAHPGEGTLAELPKGATQVELVLAASQVLITRARLPTTSKRQSAALLAYAAEERLASDPDANQVSRLGQIDGDDALAVVARRRRRLGDRRFWCRCRMRSTTTSCTTPASSLRW